MPSLRRLEFFVTHQEFNSFASPARHPPPSLQSIDLRIAKDPNEDSTDPEPGGEPICKTLFVGRLSPDYQRVLANLSIDGDQNDEAGRYATGTVMADFAGAVALESLQELSMTYCRPLGDVIAPRLHFLDIELHEGHPRFNIAWKIFDECKSLQTVSLQGFDSISFIGSNPSSLKAIQGLRLTCHTLQEDGAFKSIDSSQVECLSMIIGSPHLSAFCLGHLQGHAGISFQIRLGSGCTALYLNINTRQRHLPFLKVLFVPAY